MKRVDESNRLRHEAARVIASKIINHPDVMRVGLIEEKSPDGVSHVLVAFSKRTTIDVFTSFVRMRTLGPDDDQLTTMSRVVLLDWIDVDDIENWVLSNLKLFRISETASGPMLGEHWLDKVLSVRLAIAPGSGMVIRDSFLEIIHSLRGKANKLLTQIYEAAHEGRDGMNTTAIAGPRKGIRFYNPTTGEFNTD